MVESRVHVGSGWQDLRQVQGPLWALPFDCWHLYWLCESYSLGVELAAADGNIVAEVFRCDRDNSLTVTLYVEAVPFALIEKLIGMARKNIGDFEDGTALPLPIM